MDDMLINDTLINDTLIENTSISETLSNDTSTGETSIGDTSIGDWEKIAGGITNLLAEHKAVDPVTLDLRRFNLWTDFFVVAGVTSAAHLDGLKRHLEEWADENRVAFRRGSRHGGSRGPSPGAAPGDPNLLWDILDMGNVVVHLMSKEAREFYELEKLWL